MNNNPSNLEVGKSYWVKYKFSGNWIPVKITHITDHGHPWMEGVGVSGIVSPGMYNIREYSEIPPHLYKGIYKKALAKVNSLNDQELLDFVDDTTSNTKTYSQEDVDCIREKIKNFISDKNLKANLPASAAFLLIYNELDKIFPQ